MSSRRDTRSGAADRGGIPKAVEADRDGAATQYVWPDLKAGCRVTPRRLATSVIHGTVLCPMSQPECVWLPTTDDSRAALRDEAAGAPTARCGNGSAIGQGLAVPAVKSSGRTLRRRRTAPTAAVRVSVAGRDANRGRALTAARPSSRGTGMRSTVTGAVRLGRTWRVAGDRRDSWGVVGS